MPIPTPNTGENQDDFIQRCMGDENMNSEYPDSSQRYAICIGQTKKEENITSVLQQFIKEIKDGK